MLKISRLLIFCVLLASSLTLLGVSGKPVFASSHVAFRWTPPTGPFRDCVSYGQICRCRGNVMDCRNPRPVPTPIATAQSFDR